MDGPDKEFRNGVRTKYNSLVGIWDTDDSWHERVRLEIGRAVARLGELFPGEHGLVADIGSGGNVQPIRSRAYLQADIASSKLAAWSLAVCADAQALPLRARCADVVLCLGPVVNYASLTEVVEELSRIAKPGAAILFHVELSNSLEYIFGKTFRATARPVHATFRGPDPCWVYSHRVVRAALEAAGLKIIEARYFHVLSALACRVGLNRGAATLLSKLDAAANLVPGIGGISDSVIFTCRKEASDAQSCPRP